MRQLVNASEAGVGNANAATVTVTQEHAREGKREFSKFVPALLGASLYLLNNLDVLHGLLAPPAGYVPLGIQRNSDIAIYLTWLHGFVKGWLMPNYNAPWSTPAEFTSPGLMPVWILQRVLHVSPVAALQIFSLIGYIFVAYALAFAYKMFCQTRSQAIWALLIALACVPLDSLPLIANLFGKGAQYGAATGRVHFLTLSDGFFRGLVTWPFITYGTGFQILSMGLLARYIKSSEQRWMTWLTFTCFISTFLHPFEIFVTASTVAIVLVRHSGFTAKTWKSFVWICLAAGLGVAPYAIQTLHSAWVREVAQANSITITPALLMGVVGAPATVVLILLLFGLPEKRGDEVLIVKTWVVVTLVLFFVPGLPFALHFLDGSFAAIGLLLVWQVEELLARRPQVAKPVVQFVAVPILFWCLLPHAIFRAQAWDSGVDPQNEQFAYDTCTTFHGTCLRPTAIAPAAEAATVQWLRENASPDDLVLATEDASPWMAEAPVHSFASHWLFSLLWPSPNYRNVRTAFYSGSLTVPQGHEFLAIIGARFIVVPDGSPARQYLDIALQRARLYTWTIYEVPGAHMKPYHDPQVLALGGSAH
jgi:hypothetical protein